MGRVIMSGIVPTLTAPSNVDPVLNNNSWETISKISQAGLAAQYWNVGDTKDIVINGTVGATTITNLTVQAFIIGIDHNAAREGEHLIHFQIGKIGGKLVGLVDGNYYGSISTTGAFTMNTSNTNIGGWQDSHMRKTVLGSDSASAASPTANTLLAALPDDLRAVMKSAIKYSDNYGNAYQTVSHVTATQDFLPLLAEFEYHGSRTRANTHEQDFQAQYDYYKAGNRKVHYKHNATGVTARAWTRSPDSSNAGFFCSVNTDGSPTQNNPTAPLALAPCFFV